MDILSNLNVQIDVDIDNEFGEPEISDENLINPESLNISIENVFQS